MTRRHSGDRRGAGPQLLAYLGLGRGDDGPDADSPLGVAARTLVVVGLAAVGVRLLDVDGLTEVAAMLGLVVGLAVAVGLVERALRSRAR